MIDYRHRLAFDRSARVIDPDSGHLHVAGCNISKAQVSGYLGSEIPNSERLGMDAERIYPLLRDPRELAAAAGSFEGKPLLISHRPQSARDHDHDVTVGSVHNVRWSAPYLQADLSVWDGEAIALIESGAQRQLSCGYFYDVDPTPGTFEGQRYTGRMVNLRANHVALVELGRAGSDVMVGDAAVKQLRKAIMAGDADTTQRALVALVKFLQEQMGTSPELDEISVLLDGGTDPDTGRATPAMDRMARRRATQGAVAQDRRAAAGYADRFPNANRLVR